MFQNKISSCGFVENISSTPENMVLPTPSVSGTRMVTPAPSVPETIAVEVKRTLIMDQNNTNLSGKHLKLNDDHMSPL